MTRYFCRSQFKTLPAGPWKEVTKEQYLGFSGKKEKSFRSVGVEGQIVYQDTPISIYQFVMPELYELLNQNAQRVEAEKT